MTNERRLMLTSALGGGDGIKCYDFFNIGSGNTTGWTYVSSDEMYDSATELLLLLADTATVAPPFIVRVSPSLGSYYYVTGISGSEYNYQPCILLYDRHAYPNGLYIYPFDNTEQDIKGIGIIRGK